MRNLLFVIILLFGCVSEDTDTNETNSDTNHPSEGIVSTDPPGPGDWEEDSEDEDSGEDSGEDDSDSGSDTGTPMESYVGCSNEIDWRAEPDPLNHPCNFRLQDQNGNNVELYDFQGDVILLDFSTMWCYVCKIVAEHVQEMHDDHDPFSILTILTEDSSGNSPTADDIQDWAAEYGITTSPVLAGDDSMIGIGDDLWNVNGIPCFFVIDKDFYLRKTQPGWNETTMTEYIEELIAE